MSEPLTFLAQLRLQKLRRVEEEASRPDPAYAEQLRLLEAVVDASHDAVLITEGAPLRDGGPRIRYVNAAFTRITGYSSNDVIGKTPRILQGPLTSTDAVQEMSSALHQQQAVTVRLVNYRQDRTAFWASVSITPVIGEGGQVEHWIAVMRDVSAEMAAEQAAERAREAEQENRRLASELAKYETAEQQLTYAAFHDSLTGLRNRSYLLERLKEALQRVKSRTETRFFVLYLDLDGFKAINDGLGHRAGDLVLKEVADRLVKFCRPQDTIARHGGDEFVVLLSHVASQDSATSIAERMLEELNKPYAAVTAGTLAASIGICELEARHATAEDVLREADAAMYRAKQAGGSRVVAFDEEMQQRSSALQQRKAKLRTALEHGEFALVYQPLVDLRTRRMTGVEALLRWPEEVGDPQAVVDLAESMGMGAELGLWVMRHAALQLRRWRDLRPSSNFTLSVNMSARQLESPDFVGRFIDMVAETSLDCRSLQMDVTESVLLSNADAVKTSLHELRKMGVRIALDDFGVGYSSLAYLERYPIDTLKIDRTLTQRLDGPRSGGELVRTVLQVAAHLQLRAVAEGVEEQQQEDLLLQYGCTTAQGYLYSAPCSPEEMTARWVPGAH